jgi:hypothetical protein
MYPAADLDKFIIASDATDEVIGFITLSAITSETIAPVASLFKPDAGVAHIWGVYQTLLAMYLKGYKQVNFGGCETEGTYLFKREKFRPVEELEKTHLVYDPMKA